MVISVYTLNTRCDRAGNISIFTVPYILLNVVTVCSGSHQRWVWHFCGADWLVGGYLYSFFIVYSSKINVWYHNLIPKSMSVVCYGLSPTRKKTGNVLTKEQLTENCATEEVPDGPIRALPHLLQRKIYKHISLHMKLIHISLAQII